MAVIVRCKLQSHLILTHGRKPQCGNQPTIRERNWQAIRSQAEVVRWNRLWESAVRFGILDFHSILCSSPASAMPPIISLDRITKRFPGVTALADVSLDILPGELHAIVGENGAGKSTLM